MDCYLAEYPRGRVLSTKQRWFLGAQSWLLVVAIMLACSTYSALPSCSGFVIVPPQASYFPPRDFFALRQAQQDDDDIEEDDDDDDDEMYPAIKPYGSRSLAWTKRYRKLNPYEKVRERVLKFGHRSKEDWDECVANGWQGQYVPSRPDEMYATEWVSWDEFLGLRRPYKETRNIAVNVLQLTNLDSYILFVRQNPKRAELLRIPLRPDIVYKKEGWVSEEDFFQRGEKNQDN